MLVGAGALALASSASAAPGDISTVAGNGTPGFTGDGIPATTAELNLPPAAIPTPDGAFLIPDFNNERVREVLPSGTIQTLVGDGTMGYTGDGGPASAAEIYQPRGITLTPDGGYLIADRRNQVIRKVSASGVITTVAGNHTQGFGGDNGPATSAELSYPHALSLTADGGYLIVDTNNYRIRKVSASGTITTVAGDGTFCSPLGAACGDGGAATSAQLTLPEGVAALPDGSFLIADTSDNRIRLVSASGTISTVAGTGVGCTPSTAACGDGGAASTAQLNYPEGVAPTADGGYLLSDNSDNRIRRVTPAGTITTIVGNGTAGYMGDGGAATSAELRDPEFVSITPDGGLLVADHSNQVIRAVAGTVVPQIAPPSATTNPPSPRNDNSPKVLGSAPAGSFVALYKTANCSGAPVANGSAATFASPGLTISVPNNSTTTIHAVVFAVGGQLSPCSSSKITYVEDSKAPKARITKHPKHKVTSSRKRTKVKFGFTSNERHSTFQCKIDHRRFRHCRHSKTYKVKHGKHAFRVRAIDRAGNIGKAAKFRFKVVP
jgi:hypothetical protein